MSGFRAINYFKNFDKTNYKRLLSTYIWAHKIVQKLDDLTYRVGFLIRTNKVGQTDKHRIHKILTLINSVNCRNLFFFLIYMLFLIVDMLR